MIFSQREIRKIKKFYYERHIKGIKRNGSVDIFKEPETLFQLYYAKEVLTENGIVDYNTELSGLEYWADD